MGPDSTAPATVSTAQAVVVPGTRANGARTVIRKASERVCDRITLQAMEQSFPDFVEGDAEFIRALQEKTVEHLMAGFEEAWADLFANSDFRDFTARANAVDQVFAAASNRRARGEVPQDAWKKGADPIIAIQAALLPKLQDNLEAVKQMRTELSSQTEARAQKVVSAQLEAETLESEIRNILASIQEGQKNLGSIDAQAVQEVQEAILPLLDSDKL